jgi:hypothetical protein
LLELEKVELLMMIKGLEVYFVGAQKRREIKGTEFGKHLNGIPKAKKRGVNIQCRPHTNPNRLF